MSEATHPAPLRLFALVRRDEPTVPAAEPSGIIPTFTSEELARTWIADAVDRLGWIVVPLVAIPPTPPRIESWGPGQHDCARLGPGIEAWVRITPEGRVRLVIPGGDLDITDGAVTLSLGLQEASARAAQIRVRHEERRTRKRQRRSGDSR